MTAPDVLSLTDDELITRVQQQVVDPNLGAEAFEVLYERTYEGVLRRLLSIVHSEAAVQDLLQETFLLVWQRAEQWNGQGTFHAWLYRIAVNLAYNWLRSLRRRPEQPLVMPDEGAYDAADPWSDDAPPIAPGWLVDDLALGPQAALEAAERNARLAGLIAALPDGKREVFRLVHEMELSIRDAAGQLGVPEGTVKSRLHYADQKLRQDWQQE